MVQSGFTCSVLLEVQTFEKGWGCRETSGTDWSSKSICSEIKSNMLEENDDKENLNKDYIIRQLNENAIDIFRKFE